MSPYDDPSHDRFPDPGLDLERAIGDGPPLRPATDHLAAGRRRRTRRRAGVLGAAGLAAVAVLGTTLALDAAGPSRNALEPAGTGVDRTGPARVPSPPPREGGNTREGGDTREGGESPEVPAFDGDVALTSDGRLLTAADVEVLQRIENPLGVAEPDHSLAISYTRHGRETWALLDTEHSMPIAVTDDGRETAVLLDVEMQRQRAGGSGATDPGGEVFATLREWVEHQVALSNGDQSDPLVRFGEGERLVARDGVEILDQTADVDLGERFAPPGAPSAAAMVSFEGRRWFVVARAIPGSAPEYLTTSGAVGGAGLEVFLDYASERYAGGEGLS